jgi:poly-gamma-glutamate capsule biosynthesis protein CapA/YwtB (metallophosphatase superfamily)
VRKKVISFLTLVAIFLIAWQALPKFFPKNTTSSPEKIDIEFNTLQEQSNNEEKSIKFFPTLPTLNQIFNRDHNWTATLSAQRLTSLLVTGDVIPARSVNFQAVTKKGFFWAFEEIAEVLKNADLTFINLESPLVSNCPLTNEGMVFCGDPGHLEGLLYAGVDIVSLANNHIGNHGQTGVEETIDLLASKGIACAGLSDLAIKEFNGKRVAFLAFNDVDQQPLVNSADQETITKAISVVRDKADLVVIMFHWGDEYTAMPNQRQRELAHLSIDSGADLVLGNHPHWIQPLEIYQDRLIVYAHGNTIFDQMWSQKTKEGMIGRYLFYDDTLIDVELLPTEIKDYGQPYFLEGDQKKRILGELALLSEKLSKL